MAQPHNIPSHPSAFHPIPWHHITWSHDMTWHDMTSRNQPRYLTSLTSLTPRHFTTNHITLSHLAANHMTSYHTPPKQNQPPDETKRLDPLDPLGKPLWQTLVQGWPGGTALDTSFRAAPVTRRANMWFGHWCDQTPWSWRTTHNRSSIRQYAACSTLIRGSAVVFGFSGNERLRVERSAHSCGTTTTIRLITCQRFYHPC